MKLLCAACLALSAAGCGGLLQTPYEPPAVKTPDEWNNAASEPGGGSEAELDWFKRFGDPVLDRLATEALRRNNDLAAAAVRLRRARLQAGLAADKLVPALGAEGQTEYRHGLGPRSSSSQGAFSQGGQGEPGGSFRQDAGSWSHSATATVGYEVDMWGKLASQRDAAVWEARATQEDRDSAALSLVGTVMNLYWRIAYLNERLALSGQSVAYAEKTLELARVQRGVGAVSALETAEAEQSLESQLAARADLLRQREEARNALAILSDGPPGDVGADPERLPVGELPPVQAGLPARLLGRRPDLRAAELRLREYLADVDATRASYYPSLSLTGSLGGSSTELGRVLSDPVAALAGQLALPFLRYNEMRLQVGVSRATYEEAVANFRQKLYQAMSDVENALAARRRHAERGARLERALAAAREAERLYEVRYRAGQTSLKTWLDAQEKRRAAEVSLVENRLDRLENAVTLYQALGGDAAREDGAAGS